MMPVDCLDVESGLTCEPNGPNSSQQHDHSAACEFNVEVWPTKLRIANLQRAYSAPLVCGLLRRRQLRRMSLAVKLTVAIIAMLVAVKIAMFTLVSNRSLASKAFGQGRKMVNSDNISLLFTIQ